VEGELRVETEGGTRASKGRVGRVADEWHKRARSYGEKGRQDEVSSCPCGCITGKDDDHAAAGGGGGWRCVV
jgi:hypothetical protein